MIVVKVGGVHVHALMTCVLCMNLLYVQCVCLRIQSPICLCVIVCVL